MPDWFAPALGIVAGLCSTTSFIPQVLKAWRDGDTKAISRRMYIITVAGFVLWTTYGVVIHSWPMVVFNLISLGMSATILVFKLRERA